MSKSPTEGEPFQPYAFILFLWLKTICSKRWSCSNAQNTSNTFRKMITIENTLSYNPPHARFSEHSPVLDSEQGKSLGSIHTGERRPGMLCCQLHSFARFWPRSERDVLLFLASLHSSAVVTVWTGARA